MKAYFRQPFLVLCFSIFYSRQIKPYKVMNTSTRHSTSIRVWIYPCRNPLQTFLHVHQQPCRQTKYRRQKNAPVLHTNLLCIRIADMIGEYTIAYFITSTTPQACNQIHNHNTVRWWIPCATGAQPSDMHHDTTVRKSTDTKAVRVYHFILHTCTQAVREDSNFPRTKRREIVRDSGCRGVRQHGAVKCVRICSRLSVGL